MSDTAFDLNFPLDFPRAWGSPPVTAEFRATPEDFQVDEALGFEPDGHGEHWLIHLRKRGDNTAWVAGQLAQLAGVKLSDVGYCGLKDRHAVTSQWFSVYQPKGAEPDWASLASDRLKVLQVSRHSRKLRRGQHSANHFTLRLGQLAERQADGKNHLEKRLEILEKQGLPNYFGEQRFGWDASNLHRAEALLVGRAPMRDRKLRSLALSAARSWLFNRVLAERVERDCWREPLPGDPEAHASGPLWGRGRPLSSGETLAVETAVLGPWASWCAGLEQVGLYQERRPLVLHPEGLSWRWGRAELQLSFSLPPGAFATSVLRELAELWQPERS